MKIFLKKISKIYKSFQKWIIDPLLTLIILLTFSYFIINFIFEIDFNKVNKFFENNQYTLQVISAILAFGLAGFTIYKYQQNKKRELFNLEISNLSRVKPITIDELCFSKDPNHQKHKFKLTTIKENENWSFNIFDLSPIRKNKDTPQFTYPIFAIKNQGKSIARNIRLTCCFCQRRDQETGKHLFTFSKKVPEDKIYTLDQGASLLIVTDKYYMESDLTFLPKTFLIKVSYESIIQNNSQISELFVAVLRKEDIFTFIDVIMPVSSKNYEKFISTEDEASREVIKDLKKHNRFRNLL